MSERPADQRLVDVHLAGAVEHRRRDGLRTPDGRLVDHVVVLLDELDLLFGRQFAAVEQGVAVHARGVALDLAEAMVGRPAEMRLEHLADVHARGNAQRVEDDVDRIAVLEERHVLLGHDLRDDTLVAVASGELVAFGDLALLGHVHTHQAVDARGQVVAGLARELLDVDDDAALAVGHLERGVAHLAGLLLEDGADELLFGGQLGLSLGSDLADQQVARRDLGADAHDAVLVEVGQRLLGAVGDVSRDLLVAQLGRPGLDLVLLDVHRGEHVVLDQALADDDGVLEVVALPAHEGDQQVAAERQLAELGRGAVGQHVTGLDRVTHVDDRLLVDERALVGALELEQLVRIDVTLVGLDEDAVGGNAPHLAGGLGPQHVAGIDGGAELHAGADQRSLGLEQRHCLPLHVGPHQGPVGVVVLQEGHERGGDRHHLLRRDIHVGDVLAPRAHVLTAGRVGQHGVFEELAGGDVERRARGSDGVLLFLVGREPEDVVGDPAVRPLCGTASG